MSWDKQTHNFSDLTAVKNTLQKTNQNYILYNLGKVKDLGNSYTEIFNDDIMLRMLIYKGGVILERMNRTRDCDSDDCVISECFNFDQVPDKWSLERYSDYEDYIDLEGNRSEEFENFVNLKEHKEFITKFISGKL